MQPSCLQFAVAALWQVASIQRIDPSAHLRPQKFSVASLFLTVINSPSLTVTLTGYSGAAVVGTQAVSLTTAGGHQQVRAARAARALPHCASRMVHHTTIRWSRMNYGPTHGTGVCRSHCIALGVSTLYTMADNSAPPHSHNHPTPAGVPLGFQRPVEADADDQRPGDRQRVRLRHRQHVPRLTRRRGSADSEAAQPRPTQGTSAARERALLWSSNQHGRRQLDAGNQQSCVAGASRCTVRFSGYGAP